MLKDLNLAMAAAKSTGVNLQLGEKATKLYQAYVDAGGEQKDFSGIIHQVRKGGAT